VRIVFADTTNCARERGGPDALLGDGKRIWFELPR
jgi:hypothetical protein